MPLEHLTPHLPPKQVSGIAMLSGWILGPCTVLLVLTASNRGWTNSSSPSCGAVPGDNSLQIKNGPSLSFPGSVKYNGAVASGSAEDIRIRSILLSLAWRHKTRGDCPGVICKYYSSREGKVDDLYFLSPHKATPRLYHVSCLCKDDTTTKCKGGGEYTWLIMSWLLSCKCIGRHDQFLSRCSRIVLHCLSSWIDWQGTISLVFALL